MLVERLLDLPATLGFFSTVRVDGRRASEQPTGIRLVDRDAMVPAVLDLSMSTATEVLSPRNEIRWVDTPAALRAVCGELGQADVLTFWAWT